MIYFMKNATVYVCLAMALSACGEKREPVQTVEWYKEHETERKAMVEKCRNNPGELSSTPNCINAKKAENMKAAARRGYVNPMVE